jgi:DNA-binding GntR family transcriptional regulator
VCGAVHGAEGDAITSLDSTEAAPEPRGAHSLQLRALTVEASLASRTYDILRDAIAEMPIYDGTDDDIRLDERALAEQLGISRTPVRAALQRLETDGVVQTIPRRGIYVVRKTKAEIIEVILASAALEGMAARLAAERATDAELEDLLDRYPAMRPAGIPEGAMREASEPAVDDSPISVYSAVNLKFHQQIVDLAHSELFSSHISRLKIHMRAIRQRTIGDGDRRAHSVSDHAEIVAALWERDGDRAEAAARKHGVSLAEHVRDNVSYLR